MKSTHSFLTGYLLGIAFGVIAGFFVLLNASTTPQFALDNFSFVDLKGKAIDLEMLEGKAVVVNVWATWCPPCVKEMPGMEKARSILKDDGVIFLVASDEPLEKIIRFQEKRKFDLPFCMFSIKESSPKMEEGRPQTYIFNKDKELVYNRLGAFEWDDEKVLKKLQSYIRQ
jgi:thiol-disulfide isomerase/thioredoxin